MSILYLVLLAIIQGVTEFLPVSSSAHLILPEKMGLGSQGAMIDVMAHFGSLFAVLIYFKQDVVSMLRGLKDLLRRNLNKDSVLALNLIVATPPALLLGGFMAFSGHDELLRKAWIIAAVIGPNSASKTWTTLSPCRSKSPMACFCARISAVDV